MLLIEWLKDPWMSMLATAIVGSAIMLIYCLYVVSKTKE